MMEMQVDPEPAHDVYNFRGDDLGDSSCISDWIGNKASLLLEVEEDYLPHSGSDALPDWADLPLEPHSEQGESSSTATLKASTYRRQWDSATPGVYIPAGTSYSLHYEGKNLELQASEHSKSLQGVSREEENFIILVDSSDDENLLPQLGKDLPYWCKKCGKSLQDLSRIQEHKQLHAVGNSYRCPLCGKEFFRAANLRMHKLTHSTERPHKCPVCKKGFIRTADVWRHLRSLHKVERSSVALGSANIKNHWSIVQKNVDATWHPEKPNSAVRKPEEASSKCYLCPICSKGFSNPNLLSKHKVIHRQEKPYKCKECGMAFVQLTRLKRHHQTHTGERPFYCEDCGSTFTRLSSLQRHRRVHTGEKPYSCPNCSLSFAELGTLRRHERIHRVVQT
ncbi:zinc finger protein 676-like [Rhineura floridana]|uniref:zinc finger protein 676-like n=1 Tax=Rhineura floridana TaxID=261503 RepID=UPI002AC87639|nr:zinc finger protein 676-like [Rhineura floridana]XP_061486566.1 zinc finger protein 676-like [Rhineura floridana]